MSSTHEPGKDFWLWSVVVVMALAAILWVGGATAVWMSGHRIPRGHALAGLDALRVPGRPEAAWGCEVNPFLYWFVTAAETAIAGLISGVMWRVARLEWPKRSDPARIEGLATKAQIRRAAGAASLRSRAKILRPSLDRAEAEDVGFLLGRSRGIDCWASVEDSMLLVGPPRSGKGQSVVIPLILQAPGALVTTSTRPDNLAVTHARRAGERPVAVFDPQQLAPTPSLFRPLRWSPIRGCEQPRTAMLRAEALVADAGTSGVESGSFWRTQAVIAVRCLLHAAALGGRSASDLFRWSHAASKAKEAVMILGRSTVAAEGWHEALDAIIGADERMRDSTWAMVANAFSPLADPAVLAAVSPKPAEWFEPSHFLKEKGSLYLLGTASGASATANLIAALAEDVVEAARRLAAVSPESRLDPPLSMVLDEAANYPLPSLPALMSEGGGTGICTLAVLQSLSQARDHWGREAAGAIWDSAIVKIILGGSANADDLADLSRLIGDRDVAERSETVGGLGASRSVSTTIRPRPILQPSDIRRIGIGQGLLLLRSAPPIMMSLKPWTARSDAVVLAKDRRAFEQAVRENRPHGGTTAGGT